MGESCSPTYTPTERPEKICFHSPSLISPLVSLSEFAAAYLRGHNNPDKRHFFHNQHAAEPFNHHGLQRDTNAIMNLRDKRLAGLVPGGEVVAALVVEADTQNNGFNYEIRAVDWRA
ncbi:MAG: phage terminase large subunit family protein [Desulfobulbaceae bacterium]|nr:phage terminase large subunit family protein [Desulfobulbaceae bacterium]